MAVDFKTIWKMLQACVQSKTLSPVAKLVLARLLWHRNGKTGRCDPSYSTLATGINVGRRQTMRAVKELEDDGWISLGRMGHAKSKGRRGGLPSNSFTFNWDKAPSVTGDTSLVPQETLGGVTQGTSPSDTQGTSPSVTGDTQNLESKNHEILNLGDAGGALRSGERAPLPSWATPAGNGKYFVKIESEGGDLIVSHCATTEQKLPVVSTRENAFIVPYVWPPGHEPKNIKARKEAAA